MEFNWELANASYADVRHAPNPGEKIKEWTDEEIKSCLMRQENNFKLFFNSFLKNPVNLVTPDYCFQGKFSVY